MVRGARCNDPETDGAAENDTRDAEAELISAADVTQTEEGVPVEGWEICCA
jgi:hypothetical protein